MGLKEGSPNTLIRKIDLTSEFLVLDNNMFHQIDIATVASGIVPELLKRSEYASRHPQDLIVIDELVVDRKCKSFKPTRYLFTSRSGQDIPTVSRAGCIIHGFDDSPMIQIGLNEVNILNMEACIQQADKNPPIQPYWSCYELPVYYLSHCTHVSEAKLGLSNEYLYKFSTTQGWGPRQQGSVRKSFHNLFHASK